MADQPLNLNIVPELLRRKHTESDGFGRGNPCIILIAVGFKDIAVDRRGGYSYGEGKICSASAAVSAH